MEKVIKKPRRVSAGELSRKALSDKTKYKAIDVGHAMADDISVHLRQAIENYRNMIDEDEFCVVMLIAKDPIIPNLIRRKFYCWPYLPSPRPNQAVFLYNKPLDKITKRLWVLPSDMVMAELAGSNVIVHKQYQTMQAWSVAFFKGTFWEYIRHEHHITLLSEREYMLAHKEELIKAGCKEPTTDVADPFDFDKIYVDKIIDTKEALLDENGSEGLGQAQSLNGNISGHV